MIKRVIALSVLSLLIFSIGALGANKETDVKKRPKSSTVTTTKPAVSTTSTTTTTTAPSTKKADETSSTGTTETAPETAAPVTPVVNSPEAGEMINWQVLSNGATNSSSASYALMGTIGQVATGYVSSASYGLNQGYWQDFGNPSGCCGLYTGGFTGNCDCSTDGKRNLADITRLIDRVYISKALLCCEENGDVNTDSKLNLADITKLIDHVYISKAQTDSCL